MNKIKKMILSKFISSPVVMLLERMEEKPEEFQESTRLFGRGIYKQSYPMPAMPNRWNDILSVGEYSFIERVMLRQHLQKIARVTTQEKILTESISPHKEYTADTYAAGLAQSMHATKQTTAKRTISQAYIDSQKMKEIMEYDNKSYDYSAKTKKPVR